MQYAHYQDEEKKEKVIRLIDTHYMDIKSDDYIKYNDFIKLIEDGKKAALERHPEISDDLMFVYHRCDYEEHEIYLEYWTGRLETDKEFKDRIEKLDAVEESTKQDKIKYMKQLADEYGFKVTKEE